MRDLWLSTMRTRGLRPVPLAAALGLLATAMILSRTSGTTGPVMIVCALYALVASSGIVGQDVSDGVVQLVLTRPITRAAYLGGRLLGVLTLSFVFTVAAVGASALALGRHEGVPGVVASSLSMSLWTVVVVFLLSTVLPGRADTLGALVAFMMAFFLRGLRTHIENETAVRAIDFLWDNVACIVIIGDSFNAAGATELLRWTSNMLVGVLAGVVIFNRRQFGYAD